MRARVLCVLGLLLACGDERTRTMVGSDGGGEVDASGLADSGGVDAGSIDASGPGDAGGGDAGAPIDSGAETDSGGPVDAGHDAGPTDAGCVPESLEAFCSRVGASCGRASGIDNCGAARTEECGACTAPLTCGGGGAGANECGCSAPPDVTGLTASCAGGSVRVSFTGTTTIYPYGYRGSSSGPPPPCGPGFASLVGTPGFQTHTLPGGPALGECGAYRLCAYEPLCDTAYSPGRLISVCVNTTGMLTCTVM